MIRRSRATRRPLLALLAALTLLLAGAPQAVAQEASGVEVTGIDLSAFPEVQLRVALATAGNPDPSTFVVTENGTPVDAEVSALSDETVGIMLVMDTSGSMAGEPLAQAKVAALELLDQVPGDTRVGVIGFGSSASLVSVFTTDRDVTRTAINGLEADGGTALYDALVLSAQQVGAADADRTAILALTDGADSDSSTSLEVASQAVAQVDTDFFAIGLESGEFDDAGLQALAEAAGGRVVSASDPSALSAAYADLGRRIVNQFQVVFTSTTPDPVGTFSIAVGEDGPEGSVQIALPDRPDQPASTTPTTGERALPDPFITDVEPNVLEQDWVLFAGAGLVGIAIAVTLVLVVPSDGQRPRRRTLVSDDRVEGSDGNVGERAVESVRSGFTRLTSRAVERADAAGVIDVKLDRAGIIMRAGEFVAAVIALALAAGVLGYLLFGPVLGLVLLLVPVFGANAFLSFKASRRNAKFADQLSDTLLVMSGSLRSGFGVGQAIDTVAEEMDDPMSTEFQRALLETRLGRDMEDALEGVAARVQNEDFEWVVDAMRINHQVGGDLASILDQVSETIRARNRLKRQVAALTAEGRVSAYVLSFLPIGLGLVLYSSNPDYLDVLFTRTIGQIMLGGAVLLLVAGALWLKKLIDVEY